MHMDTPFVVAIVDDDPEFCEAIRWLLRANGYDARCYGDAVAAAHHGRNYRNPSDFPTDPTAHLCAIIDKS